MDGISELGEDGDDPGLPDIASTACAGIDSYENVEISTDSGESDEDSSGELAENSVGSVQDQWLLRMPIQHSTIWKRTS